MVVVVLTSTGIAEGRVLGVDLDRLIGGDDESSPCKRVLPKKKSTEYTSVNRDRISAPSAAELPICLSTSSNSPIIASTTSFLAFTVTGFTPFSASASPSMSNR